MGGTYRQTGDYFLSNFEISEQNELFIGVWAQRHRRYLKEHHRIIAKREAQSICKMRIGCASFLSVKNILRYHSKQTVFTPIEEKQ